MTRILPVMKTHVALLALSVALAATPARAAEWFDEWDTDDSGVLDAAEFRAGFGNAGLFERWDGDDDQRLGPEELASGLYGLWDADENGELSVEEWDRAVDRWFGERDVNLSVALWDNDGNGVISREEFAQGLARTDLFARFDADNDALLAQDELVGGLFDTADVNDDEAFEEDEDGLFSGILDALFDAEEDEAAVDGVDVEPGPAGPVEAGLDPGPVDVPAGGADLLEEGRDFVQLPIPCAATQGQSQLGCEETAERFCSVLGYGAPIAFLDLQGELYAIRCRDDL